MAREVWGWCPACRRWFFWARTTPLSCSVCLTEATMARTDLPAAVA